MRFKSAAVTLFVLSTLAGSIPNVFADVVAKPGDTLWSIAATNHTTVDALLKANPTIHGQLIQIGDRIHIPGSQKSRQYQSSALRSKPSSTRLTYTVRGGDTLWAIAQRFHITVGTIQRWNPAVHDSVVAAGMTLTLYSTSVRHTPVVAHTPVKTQRASNTSHKPVSASQSTQSTQSTQSSGHVLSARASGFSPQPATLDEQNLYWMAHVIHAEAHDSSLRAQIAVGDVVLHRMQSAPGSTVHDIVFAQSGGHYQFSTAATDAIYAAPDSTSAEAATAVLVKHQDVVPGAYYFYDTASVSKDSWIAQQPVVTAFDGFVFAK